MAVTTGTGTGPAVPRSRMKFPNNLRRLRIAAGIGHQAIMAQKMGAPMTPWIYADIERGHRPVPGDLLPKLTTILNTTPEAITAATLKGAKRAAARKPHNHPRAKPKPNGRADLSGFIATTGTTPSPPPPPPLVLLFAAAANVPPKRWPLAVAILQALTNATEQD
jgi:hypothetical protein